MNAKFTYTIYSVYYFQMAQTVNTDFIPDIPRGGPLAEYRQRAKFGWKDLKLIFEEEQTLKTKVNYTIIFHLPTLLTSHVLSVSSMEASRRRPTFRPFEHNSSNE